MLHRSLRLFHSLLKPEINAAVQKLGIHSPTEIQSIAIPQLLKPGHKIITAETGSGKTLAYLLPAIQRMEGIHSHPHSPKVLIVVPSQHLQLQVTTTLSQLSDQLDKPFAFSVIPPPEGIPQSQLPPLDIGVTTIGCLTSRVAKLDELTKLLYYTRIVVMDEVDELLKDKVGRKFVDRLLQALKFKKNKDKRPMADFIFSAATLPPKKAKNDKTPRNIIQKEFKGVETISTDGIHSTPEGLEEAFVRLEKSDQKMSHLVSLLHAANQKEQILVFCNSPASAETVYQDLQVKFPSLMLSLVHGDVQMTQRTETILQIANQKPTQPHVIVATDLVARGVDFKYTSTVIHYDFPQFAKNYLHRVGRTCRGIVKSGKCKLTLCSNSTGNTRR
jgi:superfamily II DNA/RNA helicase